MNKLRSLTVLLILIAMLSLISYFSVEIVNLFSKSAVKENLQPSGQNAVVVPELKYDATNYDKVTYHPDLIDASYNTIKVLDASGQPHEMTYQPVQSLPVYNIPGSFIYGSSKYVPAYEDSVYLSKTTRLSTVSPIYKTADMMSGFCEQLKTNPIATEQTCNSIPSNQCASNTCCVLLGGDKCVAGDQHGPKQHANYTDPFLKNKDFYYYLGKCYGNCS